MAPQRALLMIADIGGYTRFMKEHRINLAHAQDVVGQLLEAVLEGAGARFQVAKLEGDAAFFYVLLKSEQDKILETFSAELVAITQAFTDRQQRISIDRLCSCDGCVQAEQLKLKFVAHVGEVAFQKVKRFNELAGVDVIVVHRMLKNSVPLSEYILMTDTLAQSLPEPLRQHAQSLVETYEGIGAMTTHYLELRQLGQLAPRRLKPSLLRRLVAWAKMTLRSIPYFLRVKVPCDGFRNLERTNAPAEQATHPH